MTSNKVHESINMIIQSIQIILNGKINNISFEEMYRNVYTIVCMYDQEYTLVCEIERILDNNLNNINLEKLEIIGDILMYLRHKKNYDILEKYYKKIKNNEIDDCIIKIII